MLAVTFQHVNFVTPSGCLDNVHPVYAAVALRDVRFRAAILGVQTHEPERSSCVRPQPVKPNVYFAQKPNLIRAYEGVPALLELYKGDAVHVVQPPDRFWIAHEETLVMMRTGRVRRNQRAYPPQPIMLTFQDAPVSMASVAQAEQYYLRRQTDLRDTQQKLLQFIDSHDRTGLRDVRQALARIKPHSDFRPSAN